MAYLPFRYEARVSSYWFDAFQALAQPSSYRQSIDPELCEGAWWLGDQRRSPFPLSPIEPEMTDWLGSENLRSVAAACQERIDAFYCRVARNEGRDARYFVEKRWPDPLMPRLTAELYPEGREIILVRDFRDMALLDPRFQREARLQIVRPRTCR